MDKEPGWPLAHHQYAPGHVAFTTNRGPTNGTIQIRMDVTVMDSTVTPGVCCLKAAIVYHEDVAASTAHTIWNKVNECMRRDSTYWQLQERRTPWICGIVDHLDLLFLQSIEIWSSNKSSVSNLQVWWLNRAFVIRTIGTILSWVDVNLQRWSL